MPFFCQFDFPYFINKIIIIIYSCCCKRTKTKTPIQPTKLSFNDNTVVKHVFGVKVSLPLIEHYLQIPSDFIGLQLHNGNARPRYSHFVYSIVVFTTYLLQSVNPLM